MVYARSASRYITAASRYHPRYKSRSSMFNRGVFPRSRNWPRQFQLARLNEAFARSKSHELVQIIIMQALFSDDELWNDLS